jgi:hypothetical protein
MKRTSWYGAASALMYAAPPAASAGKNLTTSSPPQSGHVDLARRANAGDDRRPSAQWVLNDIRAEARADEERRAGVERAIGVLSSGLSCAEQDVGAAAQ